MTEAKSVFDYHIVDGTVTGQKLANGVTDADLTKLHAIASSAAQIDGVVATTAYSMYFNQNLSTSVINTNNGTTNVVVPAIAGLKFMPMFAALCATGTPTVCTTVQIVDADANVVLSHVVADLTTTVWAGPTGGTVVTTKLGVATAANKALLITATGTLTTTTYVRGVVVGYYLP